MQNAKQICLSFCVLHSAFCIGLALATPSVSADPLPVHAEADGPWPVWLPRYEVNLDLDVAGHAAHVILRATWTNPQPLPTRQLVFNAHSRYVVPKADIGLTAKTLELLRLAPDDALGVKDPALDIQRILLPDDSGASFPLAFRYEGDTKTSLVVPLPRAVGPGESVTVVLELTLRLPPKQGRWGQWQGVTTLSNWLPVFAYYGPRRDPPTCPPTPEAAGPQPVCTWQPTPFLPWHQPFFNEAAHYRVRATVPANQHIACTGSIVARRTLADGRQQVDIIAPGVRDFAFLCSARYRIFDGTVSVPMETTSDDTLPAPRPLTTSQPPSPPPPLPPLGGEGVGVRGGKRARFTFASSLFRSTSTTRVRWCVSPPRPSPLTASGSDPIPGRNSPSPRHTSAGTATSAPPSS